MILIWLILKITSGAFFVVGTILFFTKKTSTPTFLDKNGKEVNGSIAEQVYLTLGGIKQWILLRGHSTDNPILLFLHGGPGTCIHSLFRYYNSELENHFLVVGWDQRGAGKSYSRKIDPKTMTVDQFISDLHELVSYLKKRFDKNKIYIVGESWGSLLGTLYAHKYPQDLIAYVGTGQISDMLKAERLVYQFVLSEAEKRNHKRAIKELQSIKKPSEISLKDIKKEKKWLIKFGGFVYGRSGIFLHYLPKILSVDEYAWPDIVKILLGGRMSKKLLWRNIYDMNFFKQVSSLNVPTYFILGRHDHCTSSKLAAEYFEQLDAPFKKLIWFENSGHVPMFEEPKRFNDLIVSLKQEND